LTAAHERCHSLDVNHLHRAGCLHPGWSGGWQWTQDGERKAWINLEAGSDSLRLSYRVRAPGGDWTDIVETVSIIRMPVTLCPLASDSGYGGAERYRRRGRLQVIHYNLAATPCQSTPGEFPNDFGKMEQSDGRLWIRTDRGVRPRRR
jgi:hypothetical protein